MLIHSSMIVRSPHESTLFPSLVDEVGNGLVHQASIFAAAGDIALQHKGHQAHRCFGHGILGASPASIGVLDPRLGEIGQPLFNGRLGFRGEPCDSNGLRWGRFVLSLRPGGE